MNEAGDKVPNESTDKLEGRLGQAVEAILAEPSPKDARGRLIDAAASWTPHSVAQRPWRKSYVLAGVAVAAALLFAVFVATRLGTVTSGTKVVAPTEEARTAEEMRTDQGRALQTASSEPSAENQWVTLNRVQRPAADRTASSQDTRNDSPVELQWGSNGADPCYVNALVAESAPILVANGRSEPISLGSWQPLLKAGEGSVHVWDWSQSLRSRILEGVERLKTSDCAALSPDGTLLLRANGDTLDLRTGRQGTIDLDKGTRDANRRLHHGIHLDIADIRFSPDGGRVALLDRSRSDGGTIRGIIRIVEFPSGSVLCQFPAGEPYKLRIGFSPDGKQVAAGDPARRILRRDATTGDIIRGYEPAHDDQVYSVAISPDGRFVAATQRKGAVLVWEADSGRLLYKKDGWGENIATGCLRFSPDGRHLALAGASRIVVYDSATGHLVGEIEKDTQASPAMVQWTAGGETLTEVTIPAAGEDPTSGEPRDIYPALHNWNWRTGVQLRLLIE